MHRAGSWRRREGAEVGSMTDGSELAHEAIEALAVKIDSPRFRVALNVRLRRMDSERQPLEELTVTEKVGQRGAIVPTSLPVTKGETLEIEEVGGPFRAQVGVIDIAIGGDDVRRLHLKFLGVSAFEAARDLLRRAGVFNAGGRLTLDSEIPAQFPDKTAIEQAIREALQDAPGSWCIQVALVPDFSPPWWLISIEGHDELVRLPLRPAEQNAQFLYERVRDALRRRGVVE